MPDYDEMTNMDDDYQEIEKLKKEGHAEHCACRQVWGDGECECRLYEQGHDPYAWMSAEKLDEIKLEKGTLIKINGLPFWTADEITVLGKKENYELANVISEKKGKN